MSKHASRSGSSSIITNDQAAAKASISSSTNNQGVMMHPAGVPPAKAPASSAGLATAFPARRSRLNPMTPPSTDDEGDKSPKKAAEPRCNSDARPPALCSPKAASAKERNDEVPPELRSLSGGALPSTRAPATKPGAGKKESAGATSSASLVATNTEWRLMKPELSSYSPETCMILRQKRGSWLNGILEKHDYIPPAMAPLLSASRVGPSAAGRASEEGATTRSASKEAISSLKQLLAAQNLPRDGTTYNTGDNCDVANGGAIASTARGGSTTSAIGVFGISAVENTLNSSAALESPAAEGALLIKATGSATAPDRKPTVATTGRKSQQTSDACNSSNVGFQMELGTGGGNSDRGNSSENGSVSEITPRASPVLRRGRRSVSADSGGRSPAGSVSPFSSPFSVPSAPSESGSDTPSSKAPCGKRAAPAPVAPAPVAPASVAPASVAHAAVASASAASAPGAPMPAAQAATAAISPPTAPKRRITLAEYNARLGFSPTAPRGSPPVPTSPFTSQTRLQSVTDSRGGSLPVPTISAPNILGSTIEKKKPYHNDINTAVAQGINSFLLASGAGDAEKKAPSGKADDNVSRLKHSGAEEKRPQITDTDLTHTRDELKKKLKDFSKETKKVNLAEKRKMARDLAEVRKGGGGETTPRSSGHSSAALDQFSRCRDQRNAGDRIDGGENENTSTGLLREHDQQRAGKKRPLSSSSSEDLVSATDLLLKKRARVDPPLTRGTTQGLVPLVLRQALTQHSSSSAAAGRDSSSAASRAVSGRMNPVHPRCVEEAAEDSIDMRRFERSLSARDLTCTVCSPNQEFDTFTNLFQHTLSKHPRYLDQLQSEAEHRGGPYLLLWNRTKDHVFASRQREEAIIQRNVLRGRANAAVPSLTTGSIAAAGHSDSSSGQPRVLDAGGRLFTGGSSSSSAAPEISGLLPRGEAELLVVPPAPQQPLERSPVRRRPPLPTGLRREKNPTISEYSRIRTLIMQLQKLEVLERGWRFESHEEGTKMK